MCRTVFHRYTCSRRSTVLSQRRRVESRSARLFRWKLQRAPSSLGIQSGDVDAADFVSIQNVVSRDRFASAQTPLLPPSHSSFPGKLINNFVPTKVSRWRRFPTEWTHSRRRTKTDCRFIQIPNSIYPSDIIFFLFPLFFSDSFS